MSLLFENTDRIPDSNADAPYTQLASHFVRVKLGEIFKISDNSFELVCSDCSHAFRELIQFSSHIQEHSAGSVLCIAHPEASANDFTNQVYVTSSSKEYDAIETYNIFDLIETDCEDSDTASDSDNIKEWNKNSVEHMELYRGIDDDFKRRLAEDGLAIDDNSPEAKEYARYIYDYEFAKKNGLFECPKCDYRSEKHYDIRRHIFRHLSRPIFTCTICNKKSSSIRNHRELHQRQKANRSKKIEIENWKKRMTFNSNVISEHIKKRLLRENFTIDDSPEALEYARYIYDYKFSKKNGLFNCPKCDFASKSSHIVRRHIFKHLTRNIFTCLMCDRKVSSFLRHKEIHAENRSTSESIFNDTLDETNHESDEWKKSFCGIDDEIEKRLAEDNFELDDSPEAEEYSRYLFDYRFNDMNGLFKCPKCEYISTQNHHVRRHIFGHLRRNIFRCTVCHEKMSHISCLSKHKRLHKLQTFHQKTEIIRRQ